MAASVVIEPSFVRADRVHAFGGAAFSRGRLYDRLHRRVGGADRRSDDLVRLAGDRAATVASRCAQRHDTQAAACRRRALLAFRTRCPSLAFWPGRSCRARRACRSCRSFFTHGAGLAPRALWTGVSLRSLEAAGQKKCRGNEYRCRQKSHLSPPLDLLSHPDFSAELPFLCAAGPIFLFRNGSADGESVKPGIANRLVGRGMPGDRMRPRPRGGGACAELRMPRPTRVGEIPETCRRDNRRLGRSRRTRPYTAARSL
jgi:hypothetical protein